MSSSPRDKFEAAVKVIRGLPKNGSFQPSHELMLKFYSYFKQATEGPCRSPRPAFWDIVNKKKWEAWSNLGDMRSEEAMLLYVDELKKIVETMPQTDAVTEFLQKLDNFYEMVEDSENHNTLKMIDKPRLNGSVCANGTSDSGDEGELPSSYRLTQLLKCDLKWWKDSPGMFDGGNNTTNGHHTPKLEYSENGGSYGHAGSDDDDDDGHDEKVEVDTEKVQQEEEAEESNADIVHTEEWERVDDSRLTLSHSNSSGESESESEEFCDTSDDPIELSIPTSSHNFVSSLPPLEENSSTSTPACGGKSVRFDPRTNITDCEISDSLLVNASQGVADTSDLTGCVPQEEILLSETFSDEGHSGDLDISMCRGGEEQDRERRRRGGGQGSREGSTATSRGGHSGSAGGGNSDAGGQRNLFPGPGGGGGWRGPGAGSGAGPVDLNEQIVVTLLRLQHDMSGVLNRLNSLEALVKEQRKEKDKAAKIKGWWPFPDLSVKSAVVIFVWPLLVHCIITYIRRRHRKLNR